MKQFKKSLKRWCDKNERTLNVLLLFNPFGIPYHPNLSRSLTVQIQDQQPVILKLSDHQSIPRQLKSTFHVGQQQVIVCRSYKWIRIKGKERQYTVKKCLTFHTVLKIRWLGTASIMNTQKLSICCINDPWIKQIPFNHIELCSCQSGATTREKESWPQLYSLCLVRL